MASQEPVFESQTSKIPSLDPKTTTPTSDPGQEPLTAIPSIPSNYSNRVFLKTILEARDGGGAALVDKKIVIGGWVKSVKEVKRDAAPAVPQPEVKDESDISPAHKDVSCMEILQTRVPLFRSIAKIFGSGGNYPVRSKLEPATSRQISSTPKLPPRPSIFNLHVGDGSCVDSLQVIVEFSEAFPFQPMPIGTCILAEGVLKQITSQERQSIEFRVEKILHIGKVEEDKYILSKKRVPLENLRSYSHFRPRTTTVASVMRIRSGLTFATHKFFQDHGFLSVQMPIITTTDGVGFSEKFRITTLSEKEVIKKAEPKIPDDTEGVALETVQAAIKEKTNLVEQLKRSESDREALLAVEQDLLKTSQLVSQLEAKEKMKSQNSGKDKANAPEDFFFQPTYLTVSSRIHLESYACALGNVFDFGPRFRADRKISAKHVPEMWMVEAEMAFSELQDAMNCAEDYFKFLCKWVLENCSEDMKFLTKRVDRGRINLLESMSQCTYQRITYMEALETLKAADKKFETQPEWGIVLTPQQLSYLADEFYTSPVIIYNFPKEIKPFYARLNDDGKTVAAFDMVVPKCGAFIIGSQNEERFDSLNARINELGLSKEQYEWYLELRQHGTVKHSGFSLGFDFMVLFATGIPDVRDAIPFPRTSGKINN